jgi:hypothetical protein
MHELLGPKSIVVDPAHGVVDTVNMEFSQSSMRKYVARCLHRGVDFQRANHMATRRSRQAWLRAMRWGAIAEDCGDPRRERNEALGRLFRRLDVVFSELSWKVVRLGSLAVALPTLGTRETPGLVFTACFHLTGRWKADSITRSTERYELY